MTIAVVAPRVEDPTGTTEGIPTNGHVRVRLSRSGVVNGQWVTDAWSPAINLVGAALNLNLDHTTIPYELYVEFRDGRNALKKYTRFAIITDEASPTAWDDFEQVTGPDANPVLTSEVDARLTALEAANPSGPASDVDDITGISAFAQTYLDDTTAGATRTTLGVPAALNGTHTGTLAAEDITVSDDLTVTDDVSVGGDLAVTGALTVTGAVNIAANALTISDTSGLQTALDARVQIGGGLSGTATSPVVSNVRAVVVSATAPTSGQVLTASSGTAAAWASPTTGTVVDEINDVPGLTSALAGKRATLAFEPGDTFTIQKDLTTGFWPASWTGKTPVYTGGSASAGVRPTSDATVTCIWKGAAPLPAVVTSGTAGARGGVDIGIVHG